MFFHFNFSKSEEVFLIRRSDRRNPFFFLQELELERYEFILTKWTAHQPRANRFDTEEAVEEFKHEHLRSRLCEIIRITQ